MKKKIIGAALALSAISGIGSAFAAETYNATVTVPAYGGNWYSQTHEAPDNKHTATVFTTTPANQYIYGTIADQQHNNISSETFLAIGKQTPITSTAQEGDPICIMLETSAFNGDNTQVSFGWTP